ncbi:hypothetical protein CDEST_08646 [Colletotrichum destructivum]|uniref:Uncharacterized protein n=1 Tax=Colletotrichum destructivum TaxID=34406 RepID=A0AAX4IK68_9PEZI|nr:hypothetical protein CDEST_08646 [Colletotrichum destructivum]
MVSPMSSLRRRAIRRPHFPRDDLKIEIRDDPGEISSDDDDSPSPSGSTFPPGARPTEPPSPPPAPPVVLNPADPTESISSSSSSTSSDSPEPTAPPRGPQRGRPSGFDTSVTSESSSSSTSSFPTAFPQSTTGSDSQPTGGATRGGNEEGLGNDRSIEMGWTPTAIAFGTIAIAALFLVLGIGIWWCVRYQKRRKARKMYDRNISPDGSFWDPSATFSSPSAAPVRRSPSSVMAELMGHAYAAENGHGAAGAYASDNADRNSLTPQGYLDEKRHDPARQLPILEPAPVAQPNVRNSFASWIRRHHPLKLNPMSGRNSVYSTRTLAASNRSVNNAPLPPVPAVPDVYRSSDRLEVPPGLGIQHQQHNHQDNNNNNNNNNNNSSSRSNLRYTTSSSRYDDMDESPSTGYNTNSLLSLYHTQPQHPHQQQPGQPPWLMDPPPVVFGERGVSMAPTEATARTESTWRSWGGGVTQPQPQHQHQQSPPGTPRRGWIEKCIKFGGLK